MARRVALAGPGTTRKVYTASDHGGAETEYWETQWEGEPRVARGVLARLLDEHLPVGASLLEAGCGQAEVAAALASWDRPTVGIDLARRALHGARERHPRLPLATADVGRMPFADGTFDGVVSLGVVEHFEQGLLDLLVEHHRVLRPGGVLFLTVPLRSLHRRYTDVRWLGAGAPQVYEQRGRLVTATRETSRDDVDPPGAFHQYEFTGRTIVDLCRRAGFVVETWRPYAVADALSDSPLVGWLAKCLAGGGPTGTTTARPDGDAATGATARTLDPRRRLRAELRRAVIEEEGTGARRPLTWAATRVMGHMQLVVARRPVARDQGGGA